MAIIPQQQFENEVKKYADAGLYMIPLGRQQKKPLIRTGKCHMGAATTDVNVVLRWKQLFPEMNLGIVTGPESGIFVIDEDGPEGAQSIQSLEKELGPLPVTPTVYTSRGRQFYFRHPGRRVKTLAGLRPGVDVRGDGGLVAAPPSIHASGKIYEWDDLFDLGVKIEVPPAWLVEMVVDREKPVTAVQEGAGTGSISEGVRNSTLTQIAGRFLRCGLIGEPLLDAVLAVNAEQCVPPLDEAEVRAIVTSIGAKPAGPLPSPAGVYFDRDGNFLPTVLASELAKELHPVVQNQIIYVYHSGVYQERPFEFLKKLVHQCLLDRYRENRANEVARHIMTAAWRPSGFFKPNFDVVNLHNGLLDWRTGALCDHTPDFYSIVQLPIEYHPGAECPLIRDFFQRTLEPDCQDLIIEIIGYLLIPDTSMQKAFLFKAGGENGKSVLLALIGAFLGGNNTSAEKLQDLCDNRFRAANLYGKLANIFADLPATFIEEADVFKVLASGEPLSAERKGKDPFTFSNTARMLFSANSLPKGADVSWGFYRRWIILNFPHRFPPGHPDRDPKLLEKLTAPDELSGLLNLALEGLRRLNKRGFFDEPASCRAELEEYRRVNDSVLAFCDEHVEMGSQVDRAELFYQYRNFCASENLRAVSAKKFSARVRDLFPQASEVKINGQRIWKGIRAEGFD